MIELVSLPALVRLVTTPPPPDLAGPSGMVIAPPPVDGLFGVRRPRHRFAMGLSGANAECTAISRVLSGGEGEGATVAPPAPATAAPV